MAWTAESLYVASAAKALHLGVGMVVSQRVEKYARSALPIPQGEARVGQEKKGMTEVPEADPLFLLRYLRIVSHESGPSLPLPPVSMPCAANIGPRTTSPVSSWRVCGPYS